MLFASFFLMKMRTVVPRAGGCFSAYSFTICLNIKAPFFFSQYLISHNGEDEKKTSETRTILGYVGGVLLVVGWSFFTGDRNINACTRKKHSIGVCVCVCLARSFRFHTGVV